MENSQRYKGRVGPGKVLCFGSPDNCPLDGRATHNRLDTFERPWYVPPAWEVMEQPVSYLSQDKARKSASTEHASDGTICYTAWGKSPLIPYPLPRVDLPRRLVP
jgi:hypothetical protein